MHDATRVLHAGLPNPAQGEAFLPGPIFAGSFHLAGDPSSSPYAYGRYHNPSWTHFEEALTELEGGPAVVFPSGMAAISALFATTLRRGGVLVMPSDGYYTARQLAHDFAESTGTEVRLMPTGDLTAEQYLDGVRLLLLETPSNPGLDVCDIARLVQAGHAAGALVAVDNTTATVLGQTPLGLGADFSISSDTKALTGHGDIVLGHVAAADAKWATTLKEWRKWNGCIPGPMEVWLAHRSLATLDVRLERQCGNALAIAEFLTSHPRVGRVRYPGLPDDSAFPIASRQMQHYGPVVSFELEDELQAEQFLDACSLVFGATSFGSVYTTAERRARWGGDDVPPGFIRLSAGCEDSRDLLDDLARALDMSVPGGGT